MTPIQHTPLSTRTWVRDQIVALKEAYRAGDLTGLEVLAGLEDLEVIAPAAFFEATHIRPKFLLIGGIL